MNNGHRPSVALQQLVAARCKRGLRALIDHFSARTGLLGMHERRMRTGLTILTYHRVLPLDECLLYPLPSLAMPVQAFREQVRWLAAHCDVRTVAEALTELQADSRPRTRPLVALSFDDGYSDNAEIAAPILEEHGVRGTFFISTDFVARTVPLWFDRAMEAWNALDNAACCALLTRIHKVHARNNGLHRRTYMSPAQQWIEGLKRLEPTVQAEIVAAAEDASKRTFDAERYRPMTVQQLRDLHRDGHEVASHTVSHLILPSLDDVRLEHELVRSRRSICEWVGGDRIGFCYPNGDFDTRVEKAVRAASYTYACTTRAGLNQTDACPTRLRRIDITRHRAVSRVGNHDEIAFRSEVCGLREWWRTPGAA